MRYNADVLRDIRSLGYVTVGYTTASGDFDITESPDKIASKTLHWIQTAASCSCTTIPVQPLHCLRSWKR